MACAFGSAPLNRHTSASVQLQCFAAFCWRLEGVRPDQTYEISPIQVSGTLAKLERLSPGDASASQWTMNLPNSPSKFSPHSSAPVLRVSVLNPFLIILNSMFLLTLELKVCRAESLINDKTRACHHSCNGPPTAPRTPVRSDNPCIGLLSEGTRAEADEEGSHAMHFLAFLGTE